MWCWSLLRKGILFMRKHSHLSFDERQTIKNMLDKKESFKSIARELDRDCTTISKEVKNHITIKKTGSWGHNFNDCIYRTDCSVKNLCSDPDCKYKKCLACGRCYRYCCDYKKQTCDKLSKAPYVCNGCTNRNHCSLEKKLYDPFAAQKKYELVRSQSRSGICISEEEAIALDKVISPLIMKGQSVHHICTNNKSDIMFSEKSIYNYIEAGVFTAKNIDLPRKVRYKKRKSKHDNFKVDKACRIGRTYDDFKVFLDNSSYCPIVQMDSVIGKIGGKVLLTIHFVKTEFMLAYIRDRNTAHSVYEAFEKLYWQLLPNDFMKLFPVLLGDNGTEFSDPLSIEFDAEGNRRTNVFYCDPSAPYQKGAIENNHELIRRVLPKGTSFDKLEQTDIDLMMNHINSYSRATLGDRCPIEVFEQLYGKSILEKLDVKRVNPNDIVLHPDLLK